MDFGKWRYSGSFRCHFHGKAIGNLTESDDSALLYLSNHHGENRSLVWYSFSESFPDFASRLHFYKNANPAALRVLVYSFFRLSWQYGLVVSLFGPYSCFYKDSLFCEYIRLRFTVFVRGNHTGFSPLFLYQSLVARSKMS